MGLLGEGIRGCSHRAVRLVDAAEHLRLGTRKKTHEKTAMSAKQQRRVDDTRSCA